LPRIVRAVADQLGCDVWQASSHLWMHFGSSPPTDQQLAEADRGYAFRGAAAAMVRWRRDEGHLWVTVLTDGIGFSPNGVPGLMAERCSSSGQLSRHEQSYLLWGAPGEGRHAGTWVEDRVGAHHYPDWPSPGIGATAWLRAYEYRDEHGVLQFWLYHAFETKKASSAQGGSG
jgi:hypothetical protein